MALSSEKYADGKEGLLRVLRGWDVAEDSRQGCHGGLFHCWLESVQGQGWARGDVYRLVREILEEYPGQFSEDTLDQLAEVETALTGFSHEKSILRFPNEPSDAAQFVEYVRGNHWR